MVNEEGLTRKLNDIMVNCDNLDDYKENIFRKLKSQKELWIEKINEILSTKNMSQSELAKRCGVSRSSVLYWVRGSIPQSRDMFIRIGFAAGFDINEMNYFLKRYGRYPELYSKSLEDSVYMFVLNSNEIEHSYEACKTIFERIESALSDNKEKKVISGSVETVTFTGYVMNLSAISELKNFIIEYKEVYQEAYSKLYEYVKNHVRNNNSNYIDVDNLDSINNLAEILNWPSSLKKVLYSIYQRNWIPRRNKLISLGIHLNMTLEEINKMLSLAKMEEMYVVNPFESVIMYAVIDAELNEQIYPGTNDLYEYILKIFEEVGIDKDIIDSEFSDF